MERGSREAFAAEVEGRHPSTIGLAKYFAWNHLAPHLQPVSSGFGDLAVELVRRLPDSPELTVALRKLLESKDCAVRAAVDNASSPPPA